MTDEQEVIEDQATAVIAEFTELIYTTYETHLGQGALRDSVSRYINSFLVPAQRELNGLSRDIARLTDGNIDTFLRKLPDHRHQAQGIAAQVQAYAGDLENFFCQVGPGMTREELTSVMMRCLNISRQNIQTELTILQRAWGDRLIFDRHWRQADHWGQTDAIHLDTGPVHLEHEGDSVDFDGFRISFIISALPSGRISEVLRVSALGTPNHAHRNRGVIHPHVDGNHVCTGTATNGLNAAIQRGLLSDAFQLAHNLLHTYNDRGPYHHLRDWYGQQVRCFACNETIQGAERQTLVRMHDGHQAHAACVELDNASGRHYRPDAFTDCAGCGAPFHTDLLTLQTGSDGVTSPICDGCRTLIGEEGAAAAEGQFICPLCRHHHPQDQVLDNRVVLGHLDYGCTSCCTVLEDGTVRLPSGEVVRPQPDRQGHNVHNRLVRPTFRTAVTVRCSCGAYQPEGDLRSCQFTGATCCDQCDSERLNLSREFYTNQGYADAAIMFLRESLVDEFSQGFLQFHSLCDTPPELAGEVAKRLMAHARSSRFPREYSALIEEKLAWWNGPLQDINFTLITPIEGQAHDQIVTVARGGDHEHGRTEED